MASSLLTNGFRINQAKLFVNSVANDDPQYYVVLTTPTPRQTNTLPDVFDDTLETQISPYRDMIVGKAIGPGDILQVIPNIPYSTGTAYAMYDDGNPLMFTTPYYAVVNAGSFYHVWKVLDNNMGANSTVAPNIADIDINDQVYETSDGYRWKYMYSADQFTVSKFATTSWFPLVSNNAVMASAVAGAIDVIQITAQGEGYANWLKGTFSASAIKVDGNTVLYSISDNSSANPIPGFYTGSILYVSSGTGAGSFQTIINYFTNSNGNFVVLAGDLAEAPQNGSQYEIYPEVVIYSDGAQTSNARARALINSVGNSVYLVEMLNRGAGYQYMTANVIANSVVGVSLQANVRPIFGPYGGHGFNPANELGANAVAISVQFSNNESNTIPATNDYQQIGIITAPLFSNVQLSLLWANGTPTLFEEGWVVQSRLLSNTAVSIVQGNNIITSANGDSDRFDLRIAPNDVLYLMSGDNSEHQLVNVAAITNSSWLTLEQNALWSCTTSQIYLANLSSNFVLTQIVSSNVWTVSNVVPEIEPGDVVIFSETGATGMVSAVSRSGTVKTFDTFIGMYQYLASPISGTFDQNETIFQGTSLANATSKASLFAAMSNSGSLSVFTSNQVGIFSNVGAYTIIHGSNSEASANIGPVYFPEVVFGSGQVLYAENIVAVNRSLSTTDSLTFVISF